MCASCQSIITTHIVMIHSHKSSLPGAKSLLVMVHSHMLQPCTLCVVNATVYIAYLTCCQVSIEAVKLTLL